VASGGVTSLGGFTYLNSSPVIPTDIPNTFSPNGDGINDVWSIPYLNNFPNARIRILNRYSQLVFSSTGYNQPWNGKLKGADLPIGTYYYIIHHGNGQPPMIGAVTIIR
jgi:gliding motility-associated-like protein